MVILCGDGYAGDTPRLWSEAVGRIVVVADAFSTTSAAGQPMRLVCWNVPSCASTSFQLMQRMDISHYSELQMNSTMDSSGGDRSSASGSSA